MVSASHVLYNSNRSFYHFNQESIAVLEESYRQKTVLCDQRRQFYLKYSYGAKQISTVAPRPPLPNFIKLIMQVQQTDFTGMIEKHESWASNDESIGKIICDTNCIINIPIWPNLRTKSSSSINQITIIGDSSNIDNAQTRLRNFSPITITLPLEKLKNDLMNQDIPNFIRKHSRQGVLSRFPAIQFTVNRRPGGKTYLYHSSCPRNFNLVIRACSRDYVQMVEASNVAKNLLLRDETNDIFSASLQFPLSQRKLFVGVPEGSLISSISNRTGCIIRYPVVSQSRQHSTYLLSGSARAVITAIRSIYSISPILMEFDVEDMQLYKPLLNSSHRTIDQYEFFKGFLMQIRKSSYEGKCWFERYECMRHKIVLSTSEENIGQIYDFCRTLVSSSFWNIGAPIQTKPPPCYIEYMKALIVDFYVEQVFGDDKVPAVASGIEDDSKIVSIISS